MKSVKTYKLIFRASSGDSIESTADSVGLCSADMKSLGVKPGNFVMLNNLQSLKMIFRVWPVKNIAVGNAVISKLWTPNFNIEKKIIGIEQADISRFKS
jgi:hypothetical protein